MLEANRQAKLESQIQAMTAPVSASDWTVAMNNPHSPIYKKMMEIIFVGGVRENILTEIIEWRMQMTAQELQKEKEMLLKELEEIEIEREEKIHFATTKPQPVPELEIDKEKTSKEVVEKINKHIADIKVQLDVLEQRTSEMNMQIREIKVDRDILTKEWSVLQQAKTEDFKQMIKEASTDPSFRLNDANGNVVPLTDELIEKIAKKMASPSLKELHKTETEFSDIARTETMPQPPKEELQSLTSNWTSGLNMLEQIHQESRSTEEFGYDQLTSLFRNNSQLNGILEKIGAKYRPQEEKKIQEYESLSSRLQTTEQSLQDNLSRTDLLKGKLQEAEKALGQIIAQQTKGMDSPRT